MIVVNWTELACAQRRACEDCVRRGHVGVMWL
jgi:hypothetical protein